MNTIKISNKGNTLMVAHRGVSKLEKENTCAAFIAAGNRSYFGIECDIHRTADGRFAVIHDGNTARVGIDNLEIEESTFETIRSIRLTDLNGERGRIDLRIPSLEEYISICKKYEKKSVLELKGTMDESTVAKVCEVIDDLDYFENVIFISFGYENLEKLRALRPDANIQFLTFEFTDDLIDKLLAHNFDLDVYHKVITAEKIALCHEKGIKVNCWTVDDLERAEELIGWGADYITSNILE